LTHFQDLLDLKDKAPEQVSSDVEEESKEETSYALLLREDHRELVPIFSSQTLNKYES
jgi:hypothetical protein